MTPIWSTTNRAWRLVASRRAWNWPWRDQEPEDEINVGFSRPVDVLDAVGDAVNRVVFGALTNARQATVQFTTTTFSLITNDGLPLLSPRADYTNVVDGCHPAWYVLNSKAEPKAFAVRGRRSGPCGTDLGLAPGEPRAIVASREKLTDHSVRAAYEMYCENNAEARIEPDVLLVEPSMCAAAADVCWPGLVIVCPWLEPGPNL